MRRENLFRLLLTTLLVFAMVSVASATTLLKLTLDDLVNNSARIVRGEVKELTPREERGRIVTYVTLEVKEHLKGDGAPEEISFRVLGGRIEDLTTIVHGTANFAPGEHVLVFLEQPQSSTYEPRPPLVVTGMAQGKFKITTGPDQKTLYAIPSLGNTPLVERKRSRTPDGELEVRIEHAEPSAVHSSVLSLDAIRARIDSIKAPTKATLPEPSPIPSPSTGADTK